MTVNFDIVIVGAGPAGIATAISLAREGFKTALVGEAIAPRDGRTVALLDGSICFLKAIGIWDELATHAACMTKMRIIDASGSLFRPPPVTFSSSEISLEAFGYNIENTKLVDCLVKFAKKQMNLTLFPLKATEFFADSNAATIRLEDEQHLQTYLAVGAEGRHSLLRQSAGLEARSWRYPQIAITAILSHTHQHYDTSTEFHTRSGPFTLVPLPGLMSSLVWVNHHEKAQQLQLLSDDEFAQAVEQQAQSMLGAMKVESPRGFIPLSGMYVTSQTASRLALVGEAAHVFPPIGAQGLNLGLRDGAALRDAAVEARNKNIDIGSKNALERFGQGRAIDAAMRTGAIDLLNRTLLADFLPADFLRGLGLLALDLIGPLRRAVMREGLTPHLTTPQLMRRSYNAKR